jgi:hypothetical protein
MAEMNPLRRRMIEGDRTHGVSKSVTVSASGFCVVASEETMLSSLSEPQKLRGGRRNLPKCFLTRAAAIPRSRTVGRPRIASRG